MLPPVFFLMFGEKKMNFMSSPFFENTDGKMEVKKKLIVNHGKKTETRKQSKKQKRQNGNNGAENKIRVKNI